MGQQTTPKTEAFREKLKAFTQKKNGNLLLLLGLLGIILIFLSDLLGGSSPDKATAEQTAATAAPESVQYAQELESRLSDLLSEIEGVGRARVMLTLEASTEYFYAEEEKTTSSANSGANGESSQKTYENQYVLIDGKDGKAALVESYTMPEIRGVAILCEGADDIGTVKRVTDAVSVVLGLPTNRICVTKMI